MAGRRVLVAASGGLDSTSLVHALHARSRELELELAIGHVNHGLRGDEAEADEAFVVDLGQRLGIPVFCRRIDPRDARLRKSSRERPTLQEACRTLRYQALEEMAAEAQGDRVATAHTLDDQAETVLLRILRGTGPEGLAGIPGRSPDGRLVRPLLSLSRAEILAYAEQRGFDWREDTSNERTEYARNRLRRQWLPGLSQAFNPQLLRSLAQLAEGQRRELEWIEAAVEREAGRLWTDDGEFLRIETKDWEAIPAALARRLVRRALIRCGIGREVTRRHLDRVDAFLRSGRNGAELELPCGVRLLRSGACCRLGPIRVDAAPAC